MKSERQQQIVDQAIKIIDAKGIQGLTIKNLSKAIGISEPAIYRHFESKTDIILAVLDILSDAADHFANMMQSQQGTAMEKIRLIINRMVSIFIENPSFVAVIFAEEIFKNETVLKEKIISVLNKNEATVENIIQTGQTAGDIRNDLDNKYLALIIMGSFRLLVKRWYMGHYNFSLEADTDQLLHTIEQIINKKWKLKKEIMEKIKQVVSKLQNFSSQNLSDYHQLGKEIFNLSKTILPDNSYKDDLYMQWQAFFHGIEDNIHTIMSATDMVTAQQQTVILKHKFNRFYQYFE